MELKIGNMINAKYDKGTAVYCIVSHTEEVINGINYLQYNLDSGHQLYVKEGVTINSDLLDIKEHIILYEADKNKRKDDYFIFANMERVMPV